MKYENDFDTPMWGSDGSAPTIPSTKLAESIPTEESMAEYDRAFKAYKVSKK